MNDKHCEPVRHLLGWVIGIPFGWTDVIVVAAWGLAGLVLAIRFFSWESRSG